MLFLPGQGIGGDKNHIDILAPAGVELNLFLENLLQDALAVVTGGQIEQVFDRGRVIVLFFGVDAAADDGTAQRFETFAESASQAIAPVGVGHQDNGVMFVLGQCEIGNLFHLVFGAQAKLIQVQSGFVEV